MVCEYCHYYTLHSLKKSNTILLNIRKKFKITNNIDLICEKCYIKFKKAESLHIQKSINFYTMD